MKRAKTERYRRIDRAMCDYCFAVIEGRESFRAAESVNRVRAALPDYTIDELWVVIENRLSFLDLRRDELIRIARYVTVERESATSAGVEAMGLGGRPC